MIIPRVTAAVRFVCADACMWFQKINVPFALLCGSLRPRERMGMLQAIVCITQHAGAAFLCKPHFIMFFQEQT